MRFTTSVLYHNNCRICSSCQQHKQICYGSLTQVYKTASSFLIWDLSHLISSNVRSWITSVGIATPLHWSMLKLFSICSMYFSWWSDIVPLTRIRIFRQWSIKILLTYLLTSISPGPSFSDNSAILLQVSFLFLAIWQNKEIVNVNGNNQGLFSLLTL